MTWVQVFCLIGSPRKHCMEVGATILSVQGKTALKLKSPWLPRGCIAGSLTQTGAECEGIGTLLSATNVKMISFSLSGADGRWRYRDFDSTTLSPFTPDGSDWRDPSVVAGTSPLVLTPSRADGVFWARDSCNSGCFSLVRGVCTYVPIRVHDYCPVDYSKCWLSEELLNYPAPEPSACS